MADTTLTYLVEVLNGAERGYPEAEQHVRERGCEFIGRRWRLPEELPRLPLCRHCVERFDPEAPDEFCPARWEDYPGGSGPHEEQARVEDAEPRTVTGDA